MAVTHKTQHLSVFAIISVIIASLAVLLNIIGINLLRKQGFQRKNQLFIILHLSILQLFVLMCVLTYWILLLAGMKETDAVMVWISTILSSSRITAALIIAILTFDRLIAIKYSLRYTIILSRRRLKVAFAVSWLSCVVMFSILKPLTIKGYQFASSVVSAPAVDILLLLFILYTYAYIYWRIPTRRKIFSKTLESSQQTGTAGKQALRVSTAIIVSYVFLLLLPDLADSIVIRFMEDGASEIIRIIAYMLNTCYLITLPMTYIFLHRDMRKMFVESIMKCCSRTRPKKANMTPLTVQTVKVTML